MTWYVESILNFDFKKQKKKITVMVHILFSLCFTLNCFYKSLILVWSKHLYPFSLFCTTTIYPGDYSYTSSLLCRFYHVSRYNILYSHIDNIDIDLSFFTIMFIIYVCYLEYVQYLYSNCNVP